AAPQDSAAPKPRNMSFIEAATVPLAALTAYQSLFDAAQLQERETVLIHAAAGGVGTFAVQLAKRRGARVLGTASPRNHDYLRSLGCDVPIDYTAGPVRNAVRQTCPAGVDVIFDCAGGGVLTASREVLRAGGRLVSLVDPGEVEALKREGLAAFYVFVTPNHNQLCTLTRMIEEEQLHTQIAACFKLEEAAKAQALSESRHACGKIVLVL
ncbi:MAG: NADP-dependent oxidoreductase, partial [Kiritimatiellae bacterium]|nr:NADP-dependent oxidoreductase [Kiritimatiellia bacterium]